MSIVAKLYEFFQKKLLTLFYSSVHWRQSRPMGFRSRRDIFYGERDSAVTRECHQLLLVVSTFCKESEERNIHLRPAGLRRTGRSHWKSRLRIWREGSGKCEPACRQAGSSLAVARRSDRAFSFTPFAGCVTALFQCDRPCCTR
ncbi:MAG: hypothetical protein Greene041662_838 [Candidatus Peregrinibacteria bacterium Greene0416_62]|nr:MAG: hypothetical protein Greene041662_838 [Candidatus Peregrinibacteria bacterium Greene0416_62]TSC98021.1 MAG: hypothetical protein Greene101449_1043 [Candidatus Peregrinibacteria bacterium Greene1014_49]